MEAFFHDRVFNQPLSSPLSRFLCSLSSLISSLSLYLCSLSFSVLSLSLCSLISPFTISLFSPLLSLSLSLSLFTSPIYIDRVPSKPYIYILCSLISPFTISLSLSLSLSAVLFSLWVYKIQSRNSLFLPPMHFLWVGLNFLCLIWNFKLLNYFHFWVLNVSIKIAEWKIYNVLNFFTGSLRAGPERRKESAEMAYYHRAKIVLVGLGCLG